MILRLISFLLLISTSFGVSAQILGCTDERANNYDAQATVNDGSCTYNITLFTPPLKYVLSSEVNETSGLAFFNGGLWTINDSGGEPIVYKLDTASGKIIQRILVKGATNVDWEELAEDNEYLYVGDFGNNSGNRKDLKIYKIRKQDIPESGDASVNAEVIYFYYPDQPKMKIQKRRYNNYDCEAFFAAGDSLYLFSKNWENYKTRVYALPKEPGDYAASLIDSFDVSGLITAADYNEQSNEVVLQGYTNKSWVPFTWLLFDFKDYRFFSGNKRRVDMPNIMTTQTESIVYVDGKHAVISSEETKLGKQSAYNFNTGKWTDKQVSIIIENGGDSFDFIITPNPVEKSKLKLNVSNIPDGEYKLQLFDSSGRMLKFKKYTLKRKKGLLSLSIKTYKLTPGLYSIRMISGDKMVSRTFIKK
jgi:hypothetical protein